MIRTLIKLVFACFIYCGLYYGALFSKNPLPLMGLAFLFAGICIWRYDRGRRKANFRKMQQWKFLQYRRHLKH